LLSHTINKLSWYIAWTPGCYTVSLGKWFFDISKDGGAFIFEG